MVRKYLVFCAYIILGIIILCFFLFNNKKDTHDCLVYPDYLIDAFEPDNTNSPQPTSTPLSTITPLFQEMKFSDNVIVLKPFIIEAYKSNMIFLY